MKKRVLLLMAALLALSLLFVSPAATLSASADALWTGNEWDTNATFAVNREDPHANFISYTNEADALKYFTLEKQKSDLYSSLDGTWNFYWAHNPANRPTDESMPGFTEVGFDASGWDTTEVPKNWQNNWNADGSFKYDGLIFMTSGTSWGGTYYDKEGNQLRNTGISQPAAPKNYNPVGTYRRTFTVPAQWKTDNRSVFVHFDGVGTNCYVWVNGHQVGYAEDSFTQKDFDITPYINYDGQNVIVVQAFRWNSGSWFELQDMNRLSGIFRSVGLVARSKVDLYDFQTMTTPVVEDQYNGDWNLNIKALLRDLGATAAQRNGARLSAKLYDASGAVVGEVGNETAATFATKQNLLGNNYVGANLEFNMRVATPALWSAESPNLYKLVLTMKNGANVTEVTCIRIGFRQVKVVNNGTLDVRFLLNGTRIVFHGVNQHESNPETGFTQNMNLIRKDIELMKQNNVNAFRMSHYPHDTRYYDLCDEYGLYVMDEANIECHGATSVVNSLNTVNAWGPSLRDRVNTMMQRDWNYPCVVSWSMGNENNSINAAAVEAYHGWTTYFAKEKDPSRPTHAQYQQTATPGADWYSGMYATVSGWRNTVNTQTKPTLQCEYLHSFGNSCGNMDEYIEIFETPKTSGGFIWDWVDQAQYTPVPGDPTKWYLGFGGDWNGSWGTASHSGNIMCNGLVSADRTPHPGLQQVKYGYRMLKASDLDLEAGTYTVSNKFSFTNANKYNMVWELKENGKVIQSGTGVLDIDPAPSGVASTSMTSKTFAIPFTLPTTVKPGAEYFFNVVFKEKNDTLWAKAGHVIAEDQFAVDFNQGPEAAAAPNGSMNVTDGDNDVKITGTDFAVTIDKSSGTISSYQFKGRDLLVSGAEPNFWRAPNENERAWYTGGTNTSATFLVNQNWRTTGSTRTTDANVEVTPGESTTTVTVTGTFPNKTGATYKTIYTIYPNGEVNVGYTYSFGQQSSNHNYAPEIGSIMTVKGDFENMTWLGRRSETYADRKTGYPVQINQSTVTDNYFQYVRAQETGMKVDTRWFALTDDNGFGMVFKGSGTIPTPPNSATVADTSLIQFNALHYRAEDFNPLPGNDAASLFVHPYQLTKRNDITLRVAITSTGVGGDNSWGAYPMTPYRVEVNNKTYNFNYSILPVESLDVNFATTFANAPYDDATTAMKNELAALADAMTESFPGVETELVAAARTLSAAKFALKSEIKPVYDVLARIVSESVSGVTLDKTTLTLDRDTTAILTATVVPSTALNKNVTWSSSDEEIILVDQNGKLTVVGKPGTATITVTTEDGNRTATCFVTNKGQSIITVATGGTVTVPIMLADAVNIAGVKGTIVYDSSLLTLESLSAAKGFMLQSSGNTFNAASSDGYDGDKIVGYATFTAKADLLDDVSTLVSFPYDKLTFWDADAEVADGNLYMMEVAIMGIPPMIGDVTLDDEVGLADAIMLMQYLAGSRELTPRQLKAADVNRDGRINVGDVTIIMQMCL